MSGELVPLDLNQRLEAARKSMHQKGSSKTIIPWDFVDFCLAARLSGYETAALLGIHEDVLYNACKVDKDQEFRQYKAQKRAMGYGLLKLAKFEKALKGDIALMIWESKQHGELDKPKETDSGQSASFTIFEMPDNGRSVKGQNPTQKPEDASSDPEEVVDTRDRD